MDILTGLAILLILSLSLNGPKDVNEHNSYMETLIENNKKTMEEAANK